MNTSSRQIAAIVAVILLGLIIVGVVMSQNDSSTTETDALPAKNTINTKVDENATETPSADTTTTPSQSTSTTTTTDTTTPQKAVTVTYANGTFTPASVTVSTGGTVTFVNSDTKSVNISSDPHPSHTEYQALNLGLLSAGKTSSAVTFTKAGTFGYHNHLDATQAGTVVVK